MPHSGSFLPSLPPSLSPCPISWVKAVSHDVFCPSSLCLSPGHHRGAGFRGWAAKSLGSCPQSTPSCPSILSLLQSELVLHTKPSPAQPCPNSTPPAGHYPISHHQHCQNFVQEAIPRNVAPRPSSLTLSLPVSRLPAPHTLHSYSPQLSTAVLTLVLHRHPSVWNIHPLVRLENSWPFQEKIHV